MRNETWWLYVVKTQQNTLYCGITKDVHARIQKHNSGRGAKYLRGKRLPVTLKWAWHFAGTDSHSRALKTEAWFKKLPRWRKDEVICWSTNAPEHLEGFGVCYD